MSDPDMSEFPQGDKDDDAAGLFKQTIGTTLLEGMSQRHRFTPFHPLQLGFLVNSIPDEKWLLWGSDGDEDYADAEERMPASNGQEEPTEVNAVEETINAIEEALWDLSEEEIEEFEVEKWMEGLKFPIRAALRPPTREDLRGEHLISPRRRRLNRRRLQRIV